MLIEVLEAAQIPLEPLAAKLPFPLEALRGTARIDWEQFVALIEAVDAACRDRLSIEELGERMLRVPSNQFLRLAGRLVVSPRQLYAVADKLVAPATFSNITVTQTWLPSGQLAVTGTLAAGYRPCKAVFRLSHANVIALPRLLDLPPSRVEEQVVAGDHGRLLLRVPESHTIAARLRRLGRSVFAVGAALRGVARQQAELAESIEALRASRHELRRLLERLPEGVLIHRGGTMAWANAALLESLGRARLDELLGRNLLELVPAEDRPALAARMANANVNQISDERLEYRVERPDGSLRRLEAGATQIVEFEGAPARLVVLRDVTDQYRLRDQLALAERMALLGRLAAGVAHEINNPLAYAHASLEVASRDLAKQGGAAPAARLEELLARAREGTERVRGIVRDLKMLSRADDEPSEAVELPALLDSTIALAATAFRGKAQIVRTYGDAPRARATRGRLGQLFLNLLLNAADAIPDGAPDRHEIRVTTSRDALDRAVVEVADTGIGIQPEHAARVFDPFFTTKPAGAGTGLGLAICHGIVTQLGGEITFSSTPGRGTTFRVTLPPGSPSEDPSTPPLSTSGRARVLVVDDEPALLRAIAALIGQDHDVVTAASGRAALELVQVDRRFDVALADVRMDDMSGVDLFEAIAAQHPDLARRFVFMTGGTYLPRDHKQLASLPNRCIEKPFDADDLLRAIDEILSASSRSAD